MGAYTKAGPGEGGRLDQDVGTVELLESLDLEVESCEDRPLTKEEGWGCEEVERASEYE